MTHPSADPVSAITVFLDDADIAAIYTDIRATLGVPVVNLIWRHLAVFPDGLPWAWESLKPLYASGAIAAEARLASANALEKPTARHYYLLTNSCLYFVNETLRAGEVETDYWFTRAFAEGFLARFATGTDARATPAAQFH